MPVDEHQLHDAELFAALQALEFSGQAWEVFVNRLIGYGMDVLDGMCRSGDVFRVAAKRSFALGPTSDERRLLASSADDREELVLDVVTEGLRLFHQRGLVEGEWSPHGGASLRTYFFGACLLCLPNAFRRWRGSRSGQAVPTEDRELAERVDRTTVHHDHADGVADRLLVHEELKRMPTDIRTAIVRTTLHGEALADVAARLGTTARALEGRIYRYKAARRGCGEASA